MNQRMGARPWTGRTQHDYAHLLLARNKADDSHRGRSSSTRRSQPTGTSASALPAASLRHEQSSRSGSTSLNSSTPRYPRRMAVPGGGVLWRGMSATPAGGLEAEREWQQHPGPPQPCAPNNPIWRCPSSHFTSQRAGFPSNRGDFVIRILLWLPVLT